MSGQVFTICVRKGVYANIPAAVAKEGEPLICIDPGHEGELYFGTASGDKVAVVAGNSYKFAGQTLDYFERAVKVGPVAPTTNLQANDMWLDTSTTPVNLNIYINGAFVRIGDVTMTASRVSFSGEGFQSNNVQDALVELMNDMNVGLGERYTETVIDQKLADVDALIQNETTRAEGVEADLQAQINNIEGNGSGLSLTSLNASLNAEIARAEAEETVLLGDLNAEIARAEAAESTLTTNLNAEIARAEAAESTLTTNLNAEIARAEAEETTINTRITNLNIADINNVELKAGGFLQVSDDGSSLESMLFDITPTQKNGGLDEGTVTTDIVESGSNLAVNAFDHDEDNAVIVPVGNYIQYVFPGQIDETAYGFGFLLSNNSPTPTQIKIEKVNDDNTLSLVEIANINFDKCVANVTLTTPVSAKGFKFTILDATIGNPSIKQIQIFGTLSDFLLGKVDTYELEVAVDSLQTQIDTNYSGLGTEVARAEAAENIITANLNTEIARAEAAESVIANNLSTEVASRIATDNTLSASIITETNRAELAEGVLTSNLGAEVARATGVENTITGNLNAEIARAEAVEANLANATTAETNRAEAAEGVITTNLNAEIARAEDAEATLTANLNAEIARAELAESTEAATRATNDATLQANITAEINRAEAAEGVLTGNLATEVARAEGAETSLKNYVDSLVQGLRWLNPVLEIVASEGDIVSPVVDGRYVVGNNIATYDGTVYTLEAARENDTVWCEADDVLYTFNGTSFIKIGATISHETMLGLLGGDTINGHYHLTEAQWNTLTTDTYTKEQVDAEIASVTSGSNSGISAETTRAEDAEAVLQANINTVNTALQTEVTRATTAEAGLQAYTDTETARAKAAESTLQANINAEAVTRAANDATLQANIVAETTRAEAAESELQSNIDNLTLNQLFDAPHTYVNGAIVAIKVDGSGLDYITELDGGTF